MISINRLSFFAAFVGILILLNSVVQADCIGEGIAFCQANPNACGISVSCRDDNGSTEEGITQCRNNPTSCGINTNQDNNGSTAEGVAQCQSNPASCGISVNQDNNGSTAEGVAQCQNNPASCGIDVNQDDNGSTAEGITQCQNNPAACGIIVDPQDGSTEEGIRQCRENPTSCGIASSSAFLILNDGDGNLHIPQADLLREIKSETSVTYEVDTSCYNIYMRLASEKYLNESVWFEMPSEQLSACVAVKNSSDTEKTTPTIRATGK